MKISRYRIALFLFLFVPSSATFLSAQVVPAGDDGSVLKQIILFGRHGVRSAAVPASTLAPFAVRAYPDFGVPAGDLTHHGAQAQALLGTYFRAYLLDQKLLTGDTKTDLQRSYFRSNSIQRSYESAQQFGLGLLPGATIGVHSYALGQPDPIFDPIAAKVVTVDSRQATNEAAGIFGTGAAVSSSLSGELALIRSILFDYPGETEPPPPTPAGLVDATAVPFTLTASTTGFTTASVISAGGLIDTLLAADPFVMEYADGLPMSEVAWGQITPDQLSQQTRVITKDFDIEVTPPYLDRLQSSNAAAHVGRSMEQVVLGQREAGAFGGPKTRVLEINSSDAYVEGLAGLLHLHWQLPGYQPDYCAPGGSMVFELRQSRNSGDYFVRVFYTAQTFDQLRNLTPLTLDAPPATMQLLVPGGGESGSTLDVPWERFRELLIGAIGPEDVQNPSQDRQPAVLTGVTIE